MSGPLTSPLAPPALAKPPTNPDEPWLDAPLVDLAPWEKAPLATPASVAAKFPEFAEKQAKDYLSKLDQLSAADPAVRPKLQLELGITPPATFEEFYEQTAPIFRQTSAGRVAKGAASALLDDPKPEPMPTGGMAGWLASLGQKVSDATRKVPGVGPLTSNLGRMVGETAGGITERLTTAGKEAEAELKRPKSVLEHIAGIVGGAVPVASLVPGFGSGGGKINRDLILGGGKAVGATAEMFGEGGNKLLDIASSDPLKLAGGADAERAAREEAERAFDARRFRDDYIAPFARKLGGYGGGEATQAIGETTAGLALPAPMALKAGEVGAKFGKVVGGRLPSFVGEAVSDAGTLVAKAAPAGPLVGGAAGLATAAVHPLSALPSAFYGAAGGARAATGLTKAGQWLERAGDAIEAAPAMQKASRAVGQAVGAGTAAGLTAGEGALLGSILAPAGHEREGAEGMVGFAGGMIPLSLWRAGTARRGAELAEARDAYAPRGERMAYGEQLDSLHAAGIEGLDPQTVRELNIARGILGTIAGPDGSARRLVVLQPEAFAQQAASVRNPAGIDAANARGFFRESDGTIYANRAGMSGPESVRQVVEHEGGHALWSAFAAANPTAAAPIREEILRQIIDESGEPTAYLREFARNYGADLSNAEGLKRAAGYYADELLAQTGASLGAFADTGRLIKSPEVSERVQQWISDALVRRNPSRVDLRVENTKGEVVPVNPTAREGIRGVFSGQIREGLARAADPNVKDPSARVHGPLTSPVALPAPTPASVPQLPPAPITKPLTGERPGTAPEPPAVPPAPSGTPSVAADALAALRKLGFSEKDAQARIDEALAGGTYLDAGELVRDALKGSVGPLTGKPFEKPSPDRGQPGPLTSPLPEKPRETAPPAPPAEPAPPSPKKAPPMSRDEIVELERNFQPPEYRPRGTPEEQAAKQAARRRELLEREIWTQHAAKVEPGDNRVTLRVDERTGRAEVRGQRIDTEDPVHQRLMAENIIAPGVMEPMLVAIAGKTPVTIDYLSAPRTRDAKSAAARREAQAASPAPERADGGPALMADKSILPSGFFVSKDGKLYVRGFSIDKFLSNSETLLRVMADAGMPLPFKSVNDPALVNAFQVYAQNHAGGWKGDGSARLQPTEAVDVPAGATNFKPTPLPKEVADFLNLAAANDGASKKTQRGTELREFAKTNDNPPTEAGEVNPLRERLDRSGFLKEGPVERTTDPVTGEVISQQEQDVGAKNVFESTSETIMAELIERAEAGAPPPTDTNLRATEFHGERAGLVEKGKPRADFVAAGFLPAKKGSVAGVAESLEAVAARMAAKQGMPSIRIADLVRESGMPVEDVRAWLAGAAKRGEVSLESGNWPDATAEERAVAVNHLGQPRLYVRFQGSGVGGETPSNSAAPFRAPALSRPASGGFSFARQFKPGEGPLTSPR